MPLLWNSSFWITYKHPLLVLDFCAGNLTSNFLSTQTAFLANNSCYSITSSTNFSPYQTGLDTHFRSPNPANNGSEPSGVIGNRTQSQCFLEKLQDLVRRKPIRERIPRSIGQKSQNERRCLQAILNRLSNYQPDLIHAKAFIGRSFNGEWMTKKESLRERERKCREKQNKRCHSTSQ